MSTKTVSTVLALMCLVLALPVTGQQAPIEEKGFRPEKMYSFGSLDNVNTFNGNLVVSIPIGMRYPLDGGLTYGLSLTYNSKVWDFEEWNDETGTYQLSSPGRRANAGMGWLLSMGRLVEPAHPTNPTNEWLYEGPDGADHKFSADILYATGAGCTGSYCGKTWYTRDESFLRMRELTPSLRSVESGDGTTSEFELVSGGWRLKRIHNAFKDGAGNPLSYVNVTYPSPGVIAHCPGATSVWQLNDSEGRAHFVCLKNQYVGGNATPTIDRVVLAGVGQYATYFFEYDLDASIPESCQDTVPQDPLAPLPEFDVPFLRRVKLPDGANASCSADDCSRFQLDYFASGCPTGGLQAVTLPTMGKIAYTYDVKNVQPNNPCGRLAPGTVGVSARTLFDAVGGAIGSWSYDIQEVAKGFQNYLSHHSCWTGVGPGPGEPEHYPVIRDEAVGTVTDPNGDKVVQRYSVWPGNPGHQFDEISPDGFQGQDYGLPIGKYDAAVNAHLSRELLDCDAGGANCATVRRGYLRYRLDPSGLPAEFSDLAHKTIVAERTVYLDDPVGATPRYAHVEYSDYDGFGHYRTAISSGTFENDNTRASFTNFNPGADSHGNISGNLVFSTNDPWVLGTYDTATTTDATGSSTTKHCFDRTTGWLRAVRTGEQNSVKDLVTLFTPETVGGGWSTGNVASEKFYGGDGTPLSPVAASQSICTIANGGNPGTIGYRINHTYSFGQRATSKYEGLPFFSLDRDIDPTGLTLRTRDTDGVLFATYGYDRGGRLLNVQPPGQAPTNYVYTNASVLGSQFTPARVKATTLSAAGGNVEVEYLYDALGRFWREKRLMPGPTWSFREMLYDALDRRKSVSELEPLPPSGELTAIPQHKTTFSNYDPFGRARTVTAPDGSATTVAFKGVSETIRTVGIATGGAIDTQASTTETYDRHGRLIRITEPGPGGDLLTTYAYDVVGRLSAVNMAVQNRTFDYDSRGFLRWESHPESGMTAYSYDARGNVLSKSQSAASSLFDLTYKYDAAGRLEEVRGRNPHFNPLAE